MAENDRHRNSASDDAESTAPEVPPVADALAELEEKVLVTDGGQPTDDRDPTENAHYIDDRVSGVGAARELAESLREERTEIVSWSYERVGPTNTERIPEEVDFPNHEKLARDVAAQTIDATWYAEEETVPAGKKPAFGTVYDDETRYVVVIAGADRELVIYPGGLTETRDATPVPDHAGATDDDDQLTLAEPPTYEDYEADEAGENR